MWWYEIGIQAYTAGIKAASLCSPKAKQWVHGRRDIFERLRESIGSAESADGACSRRIVWIHAASLGEFEQGRPLIEVIRERLPDRKILLTFFSPSGYEIRRNYNGADWVFYLPADTARNAARFLDIVQPEMAVFVKYEFWLNYLAELRRRQVPTYVISAIFRRDSIFFRPWGGAFRGALGTFRTIFVQDGESERLLAEFGFRNVVTAGDTRFDRVAKIVRNAVALPVVEEFAGGVPLFVAGSTWAPDEEMLAEFINRTEGFKFVIAPHEIEESRIAKLCASIEGGCQRYTSFESGRDAKVLIIDTIGILSSVYRYGRYAYVGGGFGVGIHNTLEAAVYGLPVAFGPNYKRFREAVGLIDAGGAVSVAAGSELQEWFSRLESDADAYRAAASASGSYVASNTGATSRIFCELAGGDTNCDQKPEPNPNPESKPNPDPNPNPNQKL